jgi:putative ABC transport system permease protein
MVSFSEIVREALRSQAAAKQRTILALIGIVIGIGSVIALVTVGEMVQTTSLLQFKQMGTNILTIQKGWGGKGGTHGARRQGISYADSVDLKKAVPALSATAPYTSQWGSPAFKGKRLNLPVLGVGGSFANLNKLKLQKGRFISDLDNYAFYGVLGAGAAAKLKKLGISDPIGKKIFFKKRGFVVVGVIERVPEGGMRPFEINPGMMIPIHTSFLFKKKANVQEIIARLAPGANRQGAISKLRRFFGQREKGMMLEIRSAEQLIKEMAKQSQLFTMLLGAIGSISLLVGGIGVMNVMLVAVSERRKEIGIRRAMGAQRIDIQMQFLVESVVLCLVGGLIGILIGVGTAYVLSRVNDWVFFVPTVALVLGVGVSSGIGVFFGYFPARQAAHLNPITALRDE